LAMVLTLTGCLAGCGGGGASSGTGTCSYGGKTYQVGATFWDTDGCNTCECRSEGVSCTDTVCVKDGGAPPSDGPSTADSADQICTYNGKTYPYGVTFMSTDGCNECWCVGDETTAFCTLAGCAKDAAVTGLEASVGTCAYDDQSYPTGATFPATDGCNTCECLWTHYVSCTMMTCLGDGGTWLGDAPPTIDATDGSCVYDGRTYPPEVSFLATDGCNSCRCASNGQVSCTFTTCLGDAGMPSIDAPE
jgi:hypothetical protein